ncbi:hypothetical protein GX411_09160 [Candidatus Fermentibacteria bacterium]|nr:hypothetical protein [Candidatus Fermentibacteria bacterium]
MSSCSRSAEALEFLLGLKGAEEADEYGRHADSCPDCAAALAREREIDDRLKASMAAPEILEARIEAALNLLRKTPGAWAFRLRVTGLAAAGAAALLALSRLGTGLVTGLVPRDTLQGAVQAVARFLDTAGSGSMTLVLAAVVLVAAFVVASAMPDR